LEWRSSSESKTERASEKALEVSKRLLLQLSFDACFEVDKSGFSFGRGYAAVVHDGGRVQLLALL
jgi:hypothetical protein